MDKGNANEHSQGREVSHSPSLKHVVNAMPCIINPGLVTEISDDDDNLKMMHARVDYVPSDDDVEIIGIVIPSSVERGRQRSTRRRTKRPSSILGSNRRGTSATSGEGTVKVVKNIDKNKGKESVSSAATIGGMEKPEIVDAATSNQPHRGGSVTRGRVLDSASRARRDTKGKRSDSRTRDREKDDEQYTS